jgi:hypothetical protein
MHLYGSIPLCSSCDKISAMTCELCWRLFVADVKQVSNSTSHVLFSSKTELCSKLIDVEAMAKLCRLMSSHFLTVPTPPRHLYVKMALFRCFS